MGLVKSAVKLDSTSFLNTEALCCVLDKAIADMPFGHVICLPMDAYRGSHRNIDNANPKLKFVGLKESLFNFIWFYYADGLKYPIFLIGNVDLDSVYFSDCIPNEDLWANKGYLDHLNPKDFPFKFKVSPKKEEKKKLVMQYLRTQAGRLKIIESIFTVASDPTKNLDVSTLKPEDINRYLDYLIYSYSGKPGAYTVDKISDALLPLKNFLENCKEFTVNKPQDYERFLEKMRKWGGSYEG